MAELPSGTVTFLLTDIEGSTALWERLPEAMRLTVARHDALLTERIEQHRGSVIRSRGEGDSFFAVFGRANDAVAAAREIQQALRVETWPTETPLRVRMAMHTGEAELRAGDYFGSAVNRCARLRAIAYGGQVLLSRATHDLIRDAPPEGVELLDLGEYHLKDILRPERVFQIAERDAPSAFPPLKAFEARPNNLPVQTTTLIGREREVAEVTQLLLNDVRLLTLSGTGGIGKTRLAVEVAQRLAERGLLSVAFTELAPIADPSLVTHAIAAAVGVREQVDHPLLETIVDWLRSMRLLLVLDNCEHLVAACGAVAQALRRACPELRILATSRAPLAVSGEVIWSVPLLTVSADEASEPEPHEYGEAVQLFVERARLKLSGFRLNAENADAVVEICRRLDGLPLAIELAAARIQLLLPAAMLSRLDRRLALRLAGLRICRPGSRRCGPLSPGAMTCSTIPNVQCSNNLGSSLVGLAWKQPRQSALAPTGDVRGPIEGTRRCLSPLPFPSRHSISSTSWTHCLQKTYCNKRIRSTSRASRSWRRSASTRENSFRRARSSTPFATGV